MYGAETEVNLIFKKTAAGQWVKAFVVHLDFTKMDIEQVPRALRVLAGTRLKNLLLSYANMNYRFILNKYSLSARANSLMVCTHYRISHIAPHVTRHTSHVTLARKYMRITSFCRSMH